MFVLASQKVELGGVGRVEDLKLPPKAEMAERGDVVPVGGVEQGLDAGRTDLHRVRVDEPE